MEEKKQVGAANASAPGLRKKNQQQQRYQSSTSFLLLIQ